MTNPRLPMVSVVIPVRNEARYIAGCLRSLLRGTYPAARLEILVVDGMSEDDTRGEILRVARGSRVPIILLENPRRITPTALNIGIAHARGELIIRVDAHAEYGEDYLARCVEVARETRAANVGGPIETCPGGETPTAQAIALLLSHRFGVGNSAFRTSREAREVDTVPFGCFRADILRKIGLFDERMVRHQDYDLNQRIRRAGGRIVLDPRLRIRYFARANVRDLLHQAWGTGLWNAFANHLSPVNRCVRHLLPGAFCLNTAASLGLAGWVAAGTAPAWLPFAAAPFWGLSLLYLLANLGVSARLAARHGAALGPRLVLLFPAFHLTYGAGVLWGALSVALRRFPWRPEDGVPRWEEIRVAPVEEERLAA